MARPWISKPLGSGWETLQHHDLGGEENREHSGFFTGDNRGMGWIPSSALQQEVCLSWVSVLS